MSTLLNTCQELLQQILSYVVFFTFIGRILSITLLSNVRISIAKNRSLSQRFITTIGDFLSEAIEQAKLAERLGFHSIWIEEHHSNKDYLPSPIMALAALSQHVPSLHVGTAVAVLPLYHPVRFAEDGAILDVVTNGKFIAGIGSGYRKSEFNAFNVPLRKKGEIMEEALEIISKLWKGEKLSFHGKYFELEHFELEPKPKQKPGPPIWIGGWSKKL